MHSMKIKEVLSALEQFAPLPLQEDYDNAGLQIGLTEAEVSGALLCLDVTGEIIDEAISFGCNLIVSHHPLIFHRLSHIIDEDYVQQVVRRAIKNDIAIISMHTNMDAATGGVNFKIAGKLGLENLRFFGKRQHVVNSKGEPIEGGEGVIGSFAEPLAADDLILRLKKVFDVESLQANQLLRRGIKTVGLCGGSGSFLLGDAVSAGCDAFITGEMHYHEFFGHEQEIQICVIGHYQSEQFTPEIFRDIINRCCPDVRTYITKVNTNPILYI